MKGEHSSVAVVGDRSATPSGVADANSQSDRTSAAERTDLASMIRTPIELPMPAREAADTNAHVAHAPRGNQAEPASESERDWYERIYAEAGGDISRVPWARSAPDPELLAFLADRACQYVRPGARSVVVGCGLGDDVAELRARGFDAVGLDISPCAIDWARRRWPEHADAFRVADLCELSSCLCRRFDLVVEVHTLQSVPRDVSVKLAEGLARLVHPRGVVFGVWLAAEDSAPIASDGPPWGFSARQYAEVMERAGLRAVAPVNSAVADHRGRPRLSGAFRLDH